MGIELRTLHLYRCRATVAPTSVAPVAANRGQRAVSTSIVSSSPISDRPRVRGSFFRVCGGEPWSTAILLSHNWGRGTRCHWEAKPLYIEQRGSQGCRSPALNRHGTTTTPPHQCPNQNVFRRVGTGPRRPAELTVISTPSTPPGNPPRPWMEGLLGNSSGSCEAPNAAPNIGPTLFDTEGTVLAPGEGSCT